MLHSRRSRESKAIDSEAMAAAAAIGRALDNRGTRVEADKLPRYNSSSRSNSMVRSMSMSGRQNSLRTKRNSVRASSLQGYKPKVRNSIDESEFFDAQDTFQQFGGPQAQTKPATVKKYVPGPTGLKLVEVPVTDVKPPSSRRSSLTRRSPSLISVLNSRNESLRSSSLRNNSMRRKSSLNSQSSDSRAIVQEKVAVRQKSETPSSPLRNSNTRNTLLQHSFKEETDEQLQNDSAIKDTVNPIVMPSSASNSSRPKKETSKLDSVALETSNTVQSKNNTPPSPPNILISPPGEEISDELQIGVVPSPGLASTTSDAPAPMKTVEDVINEDNMAGATPVSEQVQPDSAPSQNVIKEQGESGNSMAKYIRSANKYLNKAHEATSDETASSQDSTLVGRNDGALTAPHDPHSTGRNASPMKSALKRSTSNNSGNDHYHHDSNSTANDAYVSLATAQNTRLNAQLANEPNKRQPSVRKARPQSMTNGKALKRDETTKQKHHSFQSLPQSEIQPPARSQRRPDSSRKNTRTKAAGGAKGQSRNTDSIFYPPEPPQKRSSFERERPNQSHMGFKKLSLRDSTADILNDDAPAANNTSFTPTKGQGASIPFQAALSSGEKWNSRFQDSDSEDEGSALPPPRVAAVNPPAKTGVFSKKNKNTAVFEPPQPRYAQSASVPNSKHNTPNKKFSSLSLRSASSTVKASPAKTDNNLSNRFLSEQLPPGGGHEEGKPIKKQSFGKKLKKLFGRKK
ncbi:LAFA_0F09318g1_1 [Lachancea sp. 'fantastica']|nr:LAFA_0F09318g1_1 [Lachancea sp. 'fantastica']